jgi:alpha-L-fucosidase
VSVVEHIILGQRVINFTCEVYHEGSWSLFVSGHTIGAKRLIRGRPVNASRIRLNILDSYAVPCIEQVGVFKAYGHFELGNAFPDGLAFHGHNSFAKQGSWVESEDCWLAKGTSGSLSMDIEGSMIWFAGTRDPSYGEAKIYIDHQFVGDVFPVSPAHLPQQNLYGSAVYTYGKHSVTIRQIGSKPIAIFGLYTLSNGGHGMIEFGSTSYSVEAGESIELEVKRVGGSEAAVSVVFQTVPGTAVHGVDFDDLRVKLYFAQGEVVKKVSVRTFKSKSRPNLVFYGQLVSASGGAVVGFNQTSRIAIKNDKSMLSIGMGSIVGFGVFRALIGMLMVIYLVIFSMRKSKENIEKRLEGEYRCGSDFESKLDERCPL